MKTNSTGRWPGCTATTPTRTESGPPKICARTGFCQSPWPSNAFTLLRSTAPMTTRLPIAMYKVVSLAPVSSSLRANSPDRKSVV